MVEGGAVEGGAVKAAEFTECFRTIWTTPYIMKLALSAGIGGFLFGYDTGVISGALLYIKEDFNQVEKKTWLQETIVSMAVAGAIVGAGIGGWLNDLFGRKPAILIADVLFFIGAIIMSVAPAPWVIIIGRIFVGMGVGMASMTGPLYISEASPARIRGALVSCNALLITGGQFLSYLINLAFTHAPGTWRWMLGVAAAPAFIQFFLMLALPESPRWLYAHGKEEEAEEILRKIYTEDEVENEIEQLKQSVEHEKAEEAVIGKNLSSKIKSALQNKVVRRGLTAGITVQVAQQFVGINTVLYYSPTIVQFAGFASKSTALALSLVTSGLNAVGSIVSMFFVDKYGRRKLMLISLTGIICCLVLLFVVFREASIQAPMISAIESQKFGNSTCPDFLNAPNAGKWNCMNCLKAKCGFCTAPGNEYGAGACLVEDDNNEHSCLAQESIYFKSGCPSRFGYWAVIFLGLYIIIYSPGMGSVPWIVNSEIYPLRYRGIGGGIAAVANWSSNLIVSETFLTLTEALGSAGTFMLFAGISCFTWILIFFLVPETKGLTFEEVEQMLERGFSPCGGDRNDKGKDVEASKI